MSALRLRNRLVVRRTIASRSSICASRRFAGGIAAPSTGVPVFNQVDGAIELRNLLQKCDSMRIRKILESDVRHSISLSEYLHLCNENGIDDASAQRLLRDFHRIGVFLYFHNAMDDTVRETIFLKPEVVTDAMYAELGMTSPTQRFAHEQEERKKEELRHLEARLAPLRALKQELDGSARRHVNAMTWASFAALTGIIGVKWYASYVVLSWDIMEPVTYFVGATVGTVALWWWIATDTDYQYSNVYEHALRRRAKKLYQRAGLDEAKLGELEADLSAVRKELEVLTLTDFNPRLISAYLTLKGDAALPRNPSNDAAPHGEGAQ